MLLTGLLGPLSIVVQFEFITAVSFCLMLPSVFPSPAGGISSASTHALLDERVPTTRRQTIPTTTTSRGIQEGRRVSEAGGTSGRR